MRDEIASLRSAIDHHNYRYHVLDDPEVSRRRVRRAVRSSARARSGTSRSWSRRTRRRSASVRRRKAEFGTVVHALPMLSLDKSTTLDEIAAWDARCRTRLGTDDVLEYSCEPKIDGVAVSWSTRTACSSSARRAATARRARTSPRTCAPIASVPLQLRGKRVPATLEVRGEIYLPIEDFRSVQRAGRRTRRQADGESAQRRGRQPAPARSAHHRRAAAELLLLQRRARRGPASRRRRRAKCWRR